jgi:hypothetical protein
MALHAVFFREGPDLFFERLAGIGFEFSFI